MPRYDGKYSKIKKKSALMKTAFSSLKKTWKVGNA